MHTRPTDSVDSASDRVRGIGQTHAAMGSSRVGLQLTIWNFFETFCIGRMINVRIIRARRKINLELF